MRVANAVAAMAVGGTLAFAQARPGSSTGAPSPPDPAQDVSSAERESGAPPLPFEENRGQFASPARLVARVGGGKIFVEPGALTLQGVRGLPQGPGPLGLGEGAAGGTPLTVVNVRLAFEGASEAIHVGGTRPLPGVVNYYLGDDPAKWKTALSTFSEVRMSGLYPGIDLVLRGHRDGWLEYDLALSEDADLDSVVVRVEGSDGIRPEPDGALAIRTALGEIRHVIPAAWQIQPGGRSRTVAVRTRLLGTDRFGFVVPDRDRSLPLVIDPGLVYSTFLGGSAADLIWDLALDASGAATVACQTYSANFPTTPGAFDTTFNGSQYDGLVARLSPSGTSLVYATYLGGSGLDVAYGVAVDGTGAATVVGDATSSDFPTTPGAFDTTKSGIYDAFVARLSPSGSSLVFSTFLGGTNEEGIRGVALDASGTPFVAGWTNSPNFPTTAGAYDTTFNGPPSDGFAARFSLLANSLLFSTFLGGSASDDTPLRVWVEPSGAFVVAGVTYATNFPTTPAAFDTTYGGGLRDGFVTRFAPGGSSLVYSTFLGSSSDEWLAALSVDDGGGAVLGGQTGSPGFPVTPGAFDTTHNGDWDAFVLRLTGSGSSLIASTFLGGGQADGITGLARDSTGAVAVCGFTGSPGFPTTAGAWQTTLGGTYDAFVARLSPSSAALAYSTFLGGSASDPAFGLALDPALGATVAGQTTSADFPTSSGAFATTLSGGIDLYVARLDLLPAGASVFGTSTPGCGGSLAIGVTSVPQIGNAAFTITGSNAPPNALPGLGSGVLVFSSGGLTSPLLLHGVAVWVDPFAFFPIQATSNALGASEIPAPVPGDPSLVGLQAFLQFFWPCFLFCAPAGFCASNALAIVVQS